VPSRRDSRRRRAERADLGLEPLEPRLALAAGPGLVAVGSQPQGALTGRIVYAAAGHGWQWSDALGRYATDRGNLLALVEDFGNQDQLTFYADSLFRAGATVVPLRPVGRQPAEVVVDRLVDHEHDGHALVRRRLRRGRRLGPLPLRHRQHRR
jgi:hypothetical protein